MAHLSQQLLTTRLSEFGKRRILRLAAFYSIRNRNPGVLRVASSILSAVPSFYSDWVTRVKYHPRHFPGLPATKRGVFFLIFMLFTKSERCLATACCNGEIRIFDFESLKATPKLRCLMRLSNLARGVPALYLFSLHACFVCSHAEISQSQGRSRLSAQWPFRQKHQKRYLRLGETTRLCRYGQRKNLPPELAHTATRQRSSYFAN